MYYYYYTNFYDFIFIKTAKILRLKDNTIFNYFHSLFIADGYEHTVSVSGTI